MLLHSDALTCLDAVLGAHWNHRCGMRFSAEVIHVKRSVGIAVAHWRATAVLGTAVLIF